MIKSKQDWLNELNQLGYKQVEQSGQSWYEEWQRHTTNGDCLQIGLCSIHSYDGRLNVTKSGWEASLTATFYSNTGSFWLEIRIADFEHIQSVEKNVYQMIKEQTRPGIKTERPPESKNKIVQVQEEETPETKSWWNWLKYYIGHGRVA